MSTLTALLSDGRTVEYLPDPIGEGGMTLVHFAADKSSSVCFFRGTAGPHRLDRVKAIVGKYNPTTAPATGEYSRPLLMWPLGIVEQPGPGMPMPLIPEDYFFACGPWQGRRKDGRWCTSPKLRRRLPERERGNWLSYLRICICLAPMYRYSTCMPRMAGADECRTTTVWSSGTSSTSISGTCAPATLPTSSASAVRGGYFCYHQGQWLLVNQAMASLYVGEQLVPPGQHVALQDGQQIRLLKQGNGRLVVVQVLRA